MSSRKICRKGDLVQWGGGSYSGLVGIVIETRKNNLDAEAKVVWDPTTLIGNMRTKPGGHWQKQWNLIILSTVEQHNE